jgi:hypothetical protein
MELGVPSLSELPRTREGAEDVIGAVRWAEISLQHEIFVLIFEG